MDVFPICSDVGDFSYTLREFGLENLLFAPGCPHEIFDCFQWIENNKIELVARLNHIHDRLARGTGFSNVLEEI